jgi:hypothetical protein
MTTVFWSIAVVAAFSAVFTALKWWGKDTRGAVLIACAVIAAAFVLFTVTGCAVSPERRPWMEAGFAYDTQHTVGTNPACIVRIRAPVGFGPLQPDWLIVGYTHHSSCPDERDRHTIDQIEVIAKIPLGRPK